MKVLTVKFNKPKTYVLLVSEFFPKTHKRAGEPTEFIKKIKDGRKIHTIRANYELWKKRIEEVQAGNAVLSIRTWEGRPYRSKQIEHLVIEANPGTPGAQELFFDFNNINQAFVGLEDSENQTQTYITIDDLSKNDGLEISDFKDWFKNYDLTKPMAIIQFTDFRY